MLGTTAIVAGKGVLVSLMSYRAIAIGGCGRAEGATAQLISYPVMGLMDPEQHTLAAAKASSISVSLSSVLSLAACIFRARFTLSSSLDDSVARWYEATFGEGLQLAWIKERLP